MKIILLRLRTTGWTADFRLMPDADEIRGLFGTTEIPTPFTSQATVETVIQAVMKANPEAHGFKVLES